MRHQPEDHRYMPNDWKGHRVEPSAEKRPEVCFCGKTVAPAICPREAEKEQQMTEKQRQLLTKMGEHRNPAPGCWITDDRRIGPALVRAGLARAGEEQRGADANHTRRWQDFFLTERGAEVVAELNDR